MIDPPTDPATGDALIARCTIAGIALDPADVPALDRALAHHRRHMERLRAAGALPALRTPEEA